MPSLPPAICSTTRIVESFPVVICVARSAASACSAENVFAKNVGTVHDSALVRMVRRKNSRRVCRVISFFILSDLIFLCRHHQPNRVPNSAVVQFGLLVKKIVQRLLPR